MNVSVVNNEVTARTNKNSANQRAENLAILGSKKIIELCVGPSLKTLESAYNAFGIECWGNDIEKRWKDYYPEGKWVIGNCFEIDTTDFDTVVFAPPLSKGCTGKRIDSLSIEYVNPPYETFLKYYADKNIRKVMVLPARSLATDFDRNQFYKLLSQLSEFNIDILTEGPRNIRKYVDIYF